MAYAKHSESNDSVQVPDLSIVFSLALALCCRSKTKNESVRWLVASVVRHRYTGECDPSPWGWESRSGGAEENDG